MGRKRVELANPAGNSVWRRRIRNAFYVIAGAAVLWPYAFSFGAEGATFTLVNRTSYYLHAVINNQPSVYIPPGAVVNRNADGFANIVVDVRYSPGQGVKGSASKSFEIVYHRTSTSSEDIASTCNQQGNDCDSSTEASVTETADPVQWVVTQSDLKQN